MSAYDKGGHVARMGRNRDGYVEGVWGQKAEGKDYVEELSVDGG
jgi:hypothetical protein